MMIGEEGIIACPPALRGIALFNPSRNALVQDAEIAIPFGVQFLVGQTGQLVRTGSVEHHEPIARDLMGTLVDGVQGN